MILLDAVFLIELFLRGFYPDFIKPWMVDQLSADLWLLENPSPLFILNELFELAKTTKVTITRDFSLPEAEYFLDLLRICFQQPPSRAQSERRLKIAGEKKFTNLESNLSWGLAEIHLTSVLIQGSLKFQFL
ncbi:hypothetical protein WN943_009632 [Citrus x changshan-huyou]